MNILVTGSAGFIGFHTCLNLLKKKNVNIYSVDNLNDYYDIKIKYDRLRILKKKKNFFFKKIDITNFNKLCKFSKKNKIKYIIHLAAQAGVRHSLKKPRDYINSNLVGFFNILEISKLLKVRHLVYASTSSVYGLNENFPFKENRIADHPIQLYAATKKSNEVMAHSYSHLYKIPMTGCRFFTVYGPWGRPDMALFKFTKNIIENKKIEIFNKGNHSRDFTYCDDVAKIISKLLFKIPKMSKFFDKKYPDPSISLAPYKIFNVSSGKRVKLLSFINEIEKNLKKKSKKFYLPMQMGDIKDTLSSKTKIFNYIGKLKSTDYKIGIKNFVNWYKKYYSK